MASKTPAAGCGFALYPSDGGEPACSARCWYWPQIPNNALIRPRPICTIAAEQSGESHRPNAFRREPVLAIPANILFFFGIVLSRIFFLWYNFDEAVKSPNMFKSVVPPQVGIS